MGFYIIIRGHLGCGKSTVAKKISRILKSEYISFDKILEENGLDKKDNDFTAEDFIKADEIILPQVKKSLSEGKCGVFDGCFFFKEQINHLKRNLKHIAYIFNLKASLQTCISRDKKRKKTYGEKAAREVYALVSRCDCGIGIDTEGKTADYVVKKIISSLPSR
jgi:adenylate kinase family enzyme